MTNFKGTRNDRGADGSRRASRTRRHFIRQIRFLTVTLIEPERWKVYRQAETRTLASYVKTAKFRATRAGGWKTQSTHVFHQEAKPEANQQQDGRFLLHGTVRRRSRTPGQDKCTLTRITSYSSYRGGLRVGVIMPDLTAVIRHDLDRRLVVTSRICLRTRSMVRKNRFNLLLKKRSPYVSESCAYSSWLGNPIFIMPRDATICQ